MNENSRRGHLLYKVADLSLQLYKTSDKTPQERHSCEFYDFFRNRF